MSYVSQIFMKVFDIFQFSVVLLGHQFSFWDIFIYTGVAGIVMDFFWEAFTGD